MDQGVWPCGGVCGKVLRLYMGSAGERGWALLWREFGVPVEVAVMDLPGYVAGVSIGQDQKCSGGANKLVCWVLFQSIW